MSHKSPVQIPDMQEFLKAGVQFGHETKRWNPKMKNYIFGSKNGIHVIDITKTLPLLEKALVFLSDAARQGSVMFVGTKRQASDLVQKEAVRSGGYFVTHRWAGGLLTNFEIVKQSLKKLNQLESDFENGVVGRTKYEISKMKTEWNKLDRLYSGIKSMQRFPTALVVVDPRYEVGAVYEARRLKIPVVAITDTNCDPGLVDYVIPANDDAMGSLSLILKLLGDAVLLGNGGQGVKHHLKEYSKAEVKIIKNTSTQDTNDGFGSATPEVSDSKVSDSTTKPAKFRIKSQQSDTKGSAQVSKPAPKKSTTLKLNPRAEKALQDAGITVEKARKMSKEQLSEIKGLGEKSIEQILAA